MRKLIIITLMLWSLSACATISAIPVDMNGERAMTQTETEEVVKGVGFDILSILTSFWIW